MAADIAFTQCAEDGIGQRMHGRIRIGMALQFFIMGNFNAAQHHAITSFKLVEINALSDAHIQPLGICPCRQNSVCLMDIFHRRKLLIFRPTCNHPYLDTKFFGNCRIIREALQILFMGLGVGCKNGAQVEALRRLHRPQALAVHSAFNQATRCQLDRIGNGQAGNDTLGSFKLGNDVADQVSGNKGPRRIVNQNPLGSGAVAGGNANAARILPGGPADNGRCHPQVPNSRGKQAFVPRANHGLYMRNAGMLGEGLERPPNHRPAAN